MFWSPLSWIIKLCLKGTPLRSGHVTHLKRFFSKIYIFLLPTYLVYQNWFSGTLICPLSIWQLGLKLECTYMYICWTGKSVTNAFPRSTYIIQVLNYLLTYKININVPQDRLLCLQASTTRKKQNFENCLFKWPDLSGVPLTLYRRLFGYRLGCCSWMYIPFPDKNKLLNIWLKKIIRYRRQSYFHLWFRSALLSMIMK